MTPSLLDNELVKKYFGYDNCLGLGGSGKCTHPNCMALRILKSQQQPIRKGERYLFWHKDKVTEMVWEDFMATIEESHAEHLRLPDAFQPQNQKQEPITKNCACGEFRFWSTIHRVDGPCYQIDKPTPSPEKCECSPACNHGYSEHCNCCGALDKPKDAVPPFSREVEAKIDSIVMNWSKQDNLIKELRDLVRLARETK